MSSFGPPLSTSQLAEKLIQHGLSCSNDDERKLIEMRLRSIGYYKMEEYSWPFRKLDNPVLNTRRPTFKKGITIGLIWNNYLFDRRLRILLMDAVERIECASKTIFSQVLTQAAGHNHPHSDRQFFPNFLFPQKPGDKDQYDKWIKSVELDIKKDDSPRTVFSLVDHNEHDVKKIPIWVLMEVCPYGRFRDLFNAADSNIQNDFAKEIGLPLDFISSSFLLFNKVRNKCAHHRRVWNFSWSRTPKPQKRGKMTTAYFTAPLSWPEWYSSWNPAQNSWIIPSQPAGQHSVGIRSTAFVVLLAKVWLDHIAQTSYWKERVEKVVAPQGKVINIAEEAGFPASFFLHPLWKNSTP